MWRTGRKSTSKREENEREESLVCRDEGKGGNLGKEEMTELRGNEVKGKAY